MTNRRTLRLVSSLEGAEIEPNGLETTKRGTLDDENHKTNLQREMIQPGKETLRLFEERSQAHLPSHGARISVVTLVRA